MSSFELSPLTNFLKRINIVLNLMLFLLAVAALFIQFSIPKITIFIPFLNITIVLLTVILIFLGIIYQNKVDKDIFGDKSFNKVINEFRTDNKISSIQNARDELREGLNILLYTGICIVIYFTVVSKSIYTFVIGVTLLIIAYIYADYIPHVRHYSKLYDYYFCKNSKMTDSTRGLAHIYLEEYLKNDVINNKKPNSFYKKPPENYIEYQLPKSDQKAQENVQDKVIKNILYMRAKHLQAPIIVISVVLLFLNILFVIPSVADGVIDNFLNDFVLYFPSIEKNISYIPYISVISIAIIDTILMIANISNIFAYKDNCTILLKLKEAYNSNDSKELLDSYNFLLEKNGKRKIELLRARGVFTFCATYIDDGIILDGIDLKYRMLFCHRLHANRSRFWITFVLGLFTLVFTLFSWNVNFLLSSIIIIISVVLALLFYILWLPNLGKKRIIKQCEILIKKSQEK